MAKSVNQKLKLLYILKILMEETDRQHPISTAKLIDKLAAYQIAAERKTIYDDIGQLQDFGYSIEQIKSKVNGGYYMAEQTFKLAQVKLLVDAVSTSRFISESESREIIKKLETLVSRYDAGQLNRQVYMTNRIKTENEELNDSVDVIHRAIQQGCNISFRYLEWNVKKELVPRRDGMKYVVSPYALTCKDENYYLIAYDISSESIKHYRVDKMGGTMLLEKEKRSGRESFEKFDLAAYTNQTFGMFGGTEEIITLDMDSGLVGVVLDRFGKDIPLRSVDRDTIRVRLKVAVSGQFFGWITGLGPGVKIVSPDAVAEKYVNHLRAIQRAYEEDEEMAR